MAEAAPYKKDGNNMPQFIIQTPWYMGKTPTTSEVNYEKNINDPGYVPLDQWFKRGVTGNVARKFRKGACENCGAITHKTKECCERPKKVKVKYSNTGFAPDEYVGQLKRGSWDVKRDIWNGYDPSGFKKLIDDWNNMDARKREYVSKRPKIESEKNVDDDDKGIVENELKMSVSSTVLRIREDTAKYLRNLDETSAFYNGKTRSMMEPKPEHLMNTKELYWMTDQFEPSNDYFDMINEERYAEEARIRGNNEVCI
jgi:pre-mRNA-processing factor SLU7